MNMPLVAPAFGELASPPAEPFYFGETGAECLAWLHRPPAARARDLGVVLCNPLGYDLMLAHRTYRHLATQLADAGYPALRFDYPSTGDSVGWVDDPDRVAAWLDSIAGASAELRRRTGATQLVLFGLRGGGTLGAAAVSQRGIPGVVGFAAWAPFASGMLQVREFLALATLQANQAGPDAESDSAAAPAAVGIVRPDGGLHVAGFAFSAQTVRELESLALTGLPAPAPRCLILQRDDRRPNLRLVKHWTERGAEVESTVVPGYKAMMLDPFESYVPKTAIGAVVTWLKSVASQPLPPWPEAIAPAAPAATGIAFASRGAGFAPDVRERPVRFGEGGRLVGILATPLDRPTHPVAVLFPTVGANNHIGVNRLHVELARDLAQRGYASLRMDIDGAGESGAVAERERFWEFKTDTYLDVLAGVDWLTGQPGLTHCVLWGLCSGAFMSYHAARADPRVVGSWMFNMPMFHWHDGQAAENHAMHEAKSLGFYRQLALKPATWKRIVTGKVRAKAIFRGLRTRVLRRARGRLSLLRARWLKGASAPLKDLAELSRRGCRVSFVCSPEDIGLHEIKTHLGFRAAHATRLPGVEYVEVEPEAFADHTFTTATSQRWLRDWTLARMQALFP